MELTYTAEWQPSSNGNTVLEIGTYKGTYWRGRDGFCWVVSCNGQPVAQVALGEYADSDDAAEAAAEAAIREHAEKAE